MPLNRISEQESRNSSLACRSHQPYVRLSVMPSRKQTRQLALLSSYTRTSPISVKRPSLMSIWLYKAKSSQSLKAREMEKWARIAPPSPQSLLMSWMVDSTHLVRAMTCGMRLSRKLKLPKDSMEFSSKSSQSWSQRLAPSSDYQSRSQKNSSPKMKRNL